MSVLRGEYTTSPLPPFSHPDFVDLRSDRSSLSDMIAYHDDTVFYTGFRVPERGYGAVVSANYFDFLGVRPVLGRGFLAGEDVGLADPQALVVATAAAAAFERLGLPEGALVAVSCPEVPRDRTYATARQVRADPHRFRVDRLPKCMLDVCERVHRSREHREQSIADEYGVTRERIRQIESRLIDNLKVYMSDIIR